MWIEQRAPDSVRQDYWEGVGTTAPSLQRVLIESFDFVAVCCGARGVLPAVMADAGLRVGPLVGLALHPLWDLKSTRDIEWLVFLVWHDRVWYWHVSAPCVTYSIARHPALRSRLQPGGLAPRGPATLEGSMLLLRTMVLAFAVRAAGVRHL